MTRGLAEHLAATRGLAPDAAAAAVDAFVDDVYAQCLDRGAAVYPGLGTFRLAPSGLAFAPDPALALVVNHRFAGLDAVAARAGSPAPPPAFAPLAPTPPPPPPVLPPPVAAAPVVPAIQAAPLPAFVPVAAPPSPPPVPPPPPAWSAPTAAPDGPAEPRVDLRPPPRAGAADEAPRRGSLAPLALLAMVLLLGLLTFYGWWTTRRTAPVPLARTEATPAETSPAAPDTGVTAGPGGTNARAASAPDTAARPNGGAPQASVGPSTNPGSAPAPASPAPASVSPTVQPNPPAASTPRPAPARSVPAGPAPSEPDPTRPAPARPAPAVWPRSGATAPAPRPSAPAPRRATPAASSSAASSAAAAPRPAPALSVTDRDALVGAAPIDPAAGGYTLVAGGSPSESAAEALAAPLRAAGFRVALVPGTTADGRAIVRVCVGQFATQRPALAALARLRGGALPADAWMLAFAD